MSSISVNQLVNSLERQTASMPQGPLLWAVAESPCRLKFVPCLLVLNAQLRPEDRLGVGVNVERMKVNGRVLNAPVGITYQAVLVKSDQSREVVYSCTIDAVGGVRETGRELLYSQ
jgi:hypothetical protein